MEGRAKGAPIRSSAAYFIYLFNRLKQSYILSMVIKRWERFMNWQLFIYWQAIKVRTTIVRQLSAADWVSTFLVEPIQHSIEMLLPKPDEHTTFKEKEKKEEPKDNQNWSDTDLENKEYHSMMQLTP